MEPDNSGRYHEGSLATFRALGPDLLGYGADLLGYFLGDWQVTRLLTDRRAGTAGDFIGTAAFRNRAAAPGLAYREDGELRLGAHQGPASRELLYLSADGGGLDVRFADGREFYRLAARDGRWTAGHPCGADHYQVTGELLGPGRYTEHWQVTGPAKDYEIATTLVRR